MHRISTRSSCLFVQVVPFKGFSEVWQLDVCSSSMPTLSRWQISSHELCFLLPFIAAKRTSSPSSLNWCFHVAACTSRFRLCDRRVGALYSYAFDVFSVYFAYGKMSEQKTQESNPFNSFFFADDVPPYFKTEPVRSQLHLERNRLVLTCMAEGSWPLEFKWIHNSTELTRFSLEYRSEI